MALELKSYQGTKIIGASEEITKEEYHSIHGWDSPNDPDAPGRLVAYEQPEGMAGNHKDYPGVYVSWSPKHAFDAAYKPCTSWLDRLRIEMSELTVKILALTTALAEDKVPESQREVLGRQLLAMEAYGEILVERLP